MAYHFLYERDEWSRVPWFTNRGPFGDLRVCRSCFLLLRHAIRWVLLRLCIRMQGDMRAGDEISDDAVGIANAGTRERSPQFAADMGFCHWTARDCVLALV